MADNDDDDDGDEPRSYVVDAADVALHAEDSGDDAIVDDDEYGDGESSDDDAAFDSDDDERSLFVAPVAAAGVVADAAADRTRTARGRVRERLRDSVPPPRPPRAGECRATKARALVSDAAIQRVLAMRCCSKLCVRKLSFDDAYELRKQNADLKHERDVDEFARSLLQYARVQSHPCERRFRYRVFDERVCQRAWRHLYGLGQRKIENGLALLEGRAIAADRGRLAYRSSPKWTWTARWWGRHIPAVCDTIADSRGILHYPTAEPWRALYVGQFSTDWKTYINEHYPDCRGARHRDSGLRYFPTRASRDVPPRHQAEPSAMGHV
jgi:hypothetical protein